MSLVDEFKQFIARGNAIDLAVGVIIGAAFGKITNSLVSDVIMPPIGMVIGNAPFKSLAFTLRPEHLDPNGKVVPAVTIAYGLFIQNIVDFLIISICIFLLVHGLNRLHHNQKEEEAKAAPTPEDILLLREIRDALKAGKEPSAV